MLSIRPFRRNRGGKISNMRSDATSFLKKFCVPKPARIRHLEPAWQTAVLPRPESTRQAATPIEKARGEKSLLPWNSGRSTSKPPAQPDLAQSGLGRRQIHWWRLNGPPRGIKPPAYGWVPVARISRGETPLRRKGSNQARYQ